MLSKGLGLEGREVWIPVSWESPKKKCKTLLLPKFRVTGHFSKDEDILHVLNASSCFYYQRTLCPAIAANSGLPFLCLSKSIPPPSFIAPPTTLDTGPHLSISIFLCPLLGRWGHQTVLNTEHTPFYSLHAFVGCGQKVISPWWLLLFVHLDSSQEPSFILQICHLHLNFYTLK